MPHNTPPIRIDSFMNLAWGLTLNLSHDETQQKTGEMVKERFAKLWENSTDNDKNYLNEIMTSLSTFLRNMGYEKDFLVQELDISEKVRNEEIKNINDLADLTSLSNDGLITRIVAFLFGGASISQLIEGFFPSEANNTTPTETSKTVVEKIGDTTTTIFEKFTPDAPPEFPVPDEIMIFLIGGGIGIFALTIVIKLIKGQWIKHVILKNTIEDQQTHWKTHVRKEFIRLMSELLDDIKRITNIYYPNYNEDLLDYGRAEREIFISRLLPKEDLYVHTV